MTGRAVPDRQPVITRPTISSSEIRQAVHTAFAGGRPDVRVWFSDDEIVGLVITG